MFAVIDFETTGLGEDRRATEVAIAVLNEKFEIVDRFNSIVNPKVPVYKKSLGYSRLTQLEIDSAPTFAQLWPAIATLLSGNLVVMHNKNFDRGVLANEFDAMGLEDELPTPICTLNGAQRIMPGRPKGGYELKNLAKDLGSPSSDAHQAMADVEMTAIVFQHLFSVDSQLRRECEILLEDVVSYEAVGEAFDASPRVRHRSGGKSDAELMRIAREIVENEKVQNLSEVCKTGTLEDQRSLEVALGEIHFILQAAETTKFTAFLVQGSEAGQRKVAKALRYGRPVLTEEEAFCVIGHIKDGSY
jgi:DNA polymerase-3 subunit epsilon